jgi:hypothetical protein
MGGGGRNRFVVVSIVEEDAVELSDSEDAEKGDDLRSEVAYDVDDKEDGTLTAEVSLSQ